MDTTARGRATLIAALALAGAILSLAWIASDAHSASTADPVGDIHGNGGEAVANYDIVSARSAVRGGNLFHAVRVDGEARIGDDHTVRGSGIQIEINTEATRPGDCNGNSRDPLGRSEYVITTSGNPMLLDCTGGGIPEGQSVRAVTRGDTLVTVIPAAAIGNPSRYGWFAGTRYWDGPSTETFDFAPEAGDGSRPGMSLQRVRGGGNPHWTDCGDPTIQGAGSYDVKALRMNCRGARRIAKVYPFNPDAVKQAGWNCRSRRTGYEASVAQCLLRTDVLRAVRFKFGA